MEPERRIKSAALLVCTFRRPQTFAQLMRSVAELELPPDLDFSIVVADNNPESAWESYIKTAVASLPWPILYGHEPISGYSNARNKVIEIALGTNAEVFAAG